MATMYALPSLTDLNVTGGWSNTSGGASNGSKPTINDTAIFDANSGSARTISGNISVQNINTTGAAAMTFSGTIGAYGTVCNLSGMVSVATLNVDQQLGNTNVVTLTAANVSIGTLGVATGLTLASNVVVTGNVTLDKALDTDATTELPYTINASGYSFTLGKLTNTSAATVTVNMGSGTWTFTGSGTVFDDTWLTVTSGAGCTVNITDTSATAKQLYGKISGTSGNTAIVISATGSGGVTFVNANTFSSVTVQPGCTVRFMSGGTLTAASFSITGVAGNGITLQSGTAGNRAFLTKTGGGTVYLDYCSIKDIGFSPTSTFVGRASTDLGNNTGITFYKALPNFAAFF